MADRSSTMKSGILDKAWERTQIKVFSRWCAKHLKTRHLDFSSIETDFEDGTKLINLLEVIGKEDIGGRWHKTPKLRVQMIENCDLAVKYITEKKGIKLVGISGGDIVDKNLKLTLGLVWSCINKFQIEDISVEEATARDALLLWCKKNTQGYEDVNVTNFSTSWSSGLAFCALINKFRPKLLDYNALDRSNHTQNCVEAFKACAELGITVFLDPEDLVDTQPDEKSVVTQVAEFFHFFANESKLQSQVDKAKRMVEIQRQIDELKSNYGKEAKEWADTMAAEEANIVSTEYEKVIPAIKSRLGEVIKFGRDGRPKITDLKAKALKTWNAWTTKAKSSNRPLPVAPEGLEPETLSKKFTELDDTQTRRRAELTAELRDLQKSKVDAFESAAGAIKAQIEEARGQAENATGTPEEKINTLQGLLAKANELKGQVPSLQPQFDELVELKLNTRTKFTMFSLQNDADALVTMIERLLGQSQVANMDEDKKGKISAYEALANPKADEAKAFDAEVKAIDGDLAAKRTAYLAKTEELNTKRDSVSSLDEPYKALEQESLHIGIENTPSYIAAIYAGTLNYITTELGKIYDEMVANFDALADPIVAQIKAKDGEAAALDSVAPVDKKDSLASLLESAKEIETSLPTLDAPYDELTQFKLNLRAKAAPKDVRSSYDQLIAHLNHLIQSNDSTIVEESNNAKINAYNEKAEALMNQARELEKVIDSIGGELEEKQAALFLREKDVEEKSSGIEEIHPLYEELEKEELHLEIEDAPDAIRAYYDNIAGHIKFLISQIDSAIAAKKGLEIPEEQLNEFRETFAFFDKDGSKSLQPYELNACLTALGENATEDECKEIIKKYSATGSDSSMLFDEYVKFMLDRFSKAETADSSKDAFRAIAQNSPVLTEEQLNQYFSPEDVEYMKSQMEAVDGGYDFAKWVDSCYN